MFKLKSLFGTVLSKRSLHDEIRKKLKEKSSPKKIALEYFDFFYGSTFRQEWHGMRLAMLTGQKYIALVNNYSNLPQIRDNLEKQTALDMFDYISKLNKDNEKFEELFKKMKIPQELKIYTFDNRETRRFQAPTNENDTKQNYYCMDGASILPVLALGIEKNDLILDLCACPGGKSLAILQTMLPQKIICRDVVQSRLGRLSAMLKSYLPVEQFENLVEIEINDGFNAKDPLFDKVLVDVPCTNDKKSLFNEDNNIFSRNRNEERSNISKIQNELLVQAIKSCKLNGCVVYSTCSLSPIQNEGVVNTVLGLFSNESKFKLEIEPLDYFKEYFSYFFRFSQSCKTGLLVAPDINKNFGPFYLCKIFKRSL